MAKDEAWGTYTGQQASQIISGLQYLIDGSLLGGREKELARQIQSRLRNASMGGEKVTMVPFSPQEHELVIQVEMALWK